MAQFDLYPNPDVKGQKAVPFLIALQSDQAPAKASIVVAPLARKADPGVDAQLQRAVIVNGEPLVILFQSLSAVRTSVLGRPVGAAPEVRSFMMAALDKLFLGF